jgi:hypothetical protein
MPVRQCWITYVHEPLCTMVHRHQRVSHETEHTHTHTHTMTRIRLVERHCIAQPKQERRLQRVFFLKTMPMRMRKTTMVRRHCIERVGVERPRWFRCFWRDRPKWIWPTRRIRAHHCIGHVPTVMWTLSRCYCRTVLMLRCKIQYVCVCLLVWRAWPTRILIISNDSIQFVQHGWTALHEACSKGHQEIVSLLLEHDPMPSVNAKDEVRIVVSLCHTFAHASMHASYTNWSFCSVAKHHCM